MERKRCCELWAVGLTLVVLGGVLGGLCRPPFLRGHFSFQQGWLDGELREAISDRDYPAMRALVWKGADVNTLGDGEEPGYRVTVLMFAASSGDEALVRELLARGAFADAPSPEGITPLQIAALQGRSRIVEMLLNAGAAVNRQDGRTETVLTYAVMGRQPAVVKLLLQYGAVGDLRRKDGETPISLARQWGNREVVRTLTTAKAKRTARLP